MNYDERLKLFRKWLADQGRDEKEFIRGMPRTELEDKFVEVWHRENRLLEKYWLAKREVMALEETREKQLKIIESLTNKLAESEKVNDERMRHIKQLKKQISNLRKSAKDMISRLRGMCYDLAGQLKAHDPDEAKEAWDKLGTQEFGK